MKLQQATHPPGFARVIKHVVRRQPVLAEPYVQKKNSEKASQVERVLFDWNGPAERWRANAQGRSNVGIVEEPLCEHEIEQAAERDENNEGPPESALRDF